LLAAPGQRIQLTWLKYVEFQSKLAALVADFFAGALVSISKSSTDER
jgi:hypothetical protein